MLQTNQTKCPIEIRKGEMQPGDRVFVRLTMGNRLLTEVVMCNVGGISDVICELRSITTSRRGLAHLYVRNHSRGWALDRPMMMYGSGDKKDEGSMFGDLLRDRTSLSDKLWGEKEVSTQQRLSAADIAAVNAIFGKRSTNDDRMLMPYETH